ncbi:hypothetical protein AWB81_08213 [Caballeronia arationis]|nr:hypothetical protein AWB81_08213 [Caballeronia arationis]
MQRDQAFDRERRHPLATRLDHVLHAVDDLHIAIRIDVRDVLCVQVAALPKLIGCLRVLQVALRQPRRAHDDLTARPAVVSDVFALFVHDAQIHERQRQTRLATQAHLLVGVERLAAGLQLRERQQRSGLRHPIAGEDVDATIERRTRESMGQRASADDHFPLAQIDGLRFRAAEQHVQDRSDAMRERDAFITHEPDEPLRQVTARIDLLHTQHGSDIRHTPRVDMEHRRDRHVHVTAVKALPRYGACKRRHPCDGVQHELAVREIDALRQTRRARRIERGGARVLVEVREVVDGLARREHGLVFVREGDRMRDGFAAFVVDPDEGVHRFELVPDRIDDRQEVRMNEKDLRARMVDRVGDLRWREPHVDRLQHGTHHRNGEVAFEVAMAVPVHHRDGAAHLRAVAAEAMCKARDALAHRAIGQARFAAIDDLLIGRMDERCMQQMLDQQRVRIRRLS